jgi:hypothetical protein
MWARQALVVLGLGRISETSDNLREEALFWILVTGLAQMSAHFGFGDMNWFGHF